MDNTSHTDKLSIMAYLSQTPSLSAIQKYCKWIGITLACGNIIVIMSHSHHSMILFYVLLFLGIALVRYYKLSFLCFGLWFVSMHIRELLWLKGLAGDEATKALQEFLAHIHKDSGIDTQTLLNALCNIEILGFGVSLVCIAMIFVRQWERILPSLFLGFILVRFVLALGYGIFALGS